MNSGVRRGLVVRGGGLGRGVGRFLRGVGRGRKTGSRVMEGEECVPMFGIRAGSLGSVPSVERIVTSFHVSASMLVSLNR